MISLDFTQTYAYVHTPHFQMNHLRIQARERENKIILKSKEVLIVSTDIVNPSRDHLHYVSTCSFPFVKNENTGTGSVE